MKHENNSASVQLKSVQGKPVQIELAAFSDPVSLAGAVERTLSGAEAGRVLGFGCRCLEPGK